MPLPRPKQEVLVELDQYIQRRHDDHRRMRYLLQRGKHGKETFILMHEQCTRQIRDLYVKLASAQQLSKQMYLQHVVERILQHRYRASPL